MSASCSSHVPYMHTHMPHAERLSSCGESPQVYLQPVPLGYHGAEDSVLASHQAHRSPSGSSWTPETITTACQTGRRWSSSATRPHPTLSPPPSAPCAPIALLPSADSPRPTPADYGASVCQQDSDMLGV